VIDKNAAAADQTLFLAALPASLGLTVTSTYARRAERGWTDALAGIGLAGTTSNTGIGGRIRESQSVFKRDRAGGCRSNQDETQHRAQQRLHQDSPVNVVGLESPPQSASDHARRRRAFSSSASALLIMNSSILCPVLRAATSHRGCLPRPDQVSEGSSGF
jgi:hypothetical protein